MTVTRLLTYTRCLSFLGAMLASVAVSAIEPLPEIRQLIAQNQYKEALDKTERYLSAHPGDAQGRLFHGLILTELDRVPEAISAFSRLAADYPQLPEAHNNLAVLYARQQQYDLARAELEAALRTHPAYAVTYDNLGDLYANLASQAYDRALQRGSNVAPERLVLIRELSTPGSLPAPPGTTPAPPPTVVAEAKIPPKAPPIPPTAPPPAPPKANPPPEPVLPTPPAVPKAPTVVSPPQPPSPPPSPSITEPVVTPTVKPADPPQREVDAGREEIARTIEAWAAAWSRQDVKAYLAFYAPNFNPPKGMSRKAWEAERKDRISRPAWIKVSYEKPRITFDGKDARMQFRQRYQASGFSSNAEKTVTLTKQGTKWLIVDETTR
jgi:tetratricopeptide (TPR) repeat protein